MSSSPRRFFLCTGQCVEYKNLYKHPDSHILGELRYVSDEGRQVTGLAIWDKAVSAGEVPPIHPCVRLVIVGDARQIACTFAGCQRRERWEIGRAAFLVLMQRYQKEAAE